MQSHLDLILQIDVRSRQQTQQPPGQILWQLIPQQRVRQQWFERWRHRRCRSR
jgi:hypothetical protein